MFKFLINPIHVYILILWRNSYQWTTLKSISLTVKSIWWHVSMLANILPVSRRFKYLKGKIGLISLNDFTFSASIAMILLDKNKNSKKNFSKSFFFNPMKWNLLFQISFFDMLSVGLRLHLLSLSVCISKGFFYVFVPFCQSP